MIKLKRRFEDIHNPPFQPISCPNVYFMKTDDSGPEPKKFKSNHFEMKEDPYNNRFPMDSYLKNSNSMVLSQENVLDKNMMEPFTPSPGFVVDDKIFSFIPLKKRKKYLSASPKEKIFSKKDLSIIVQKAIEETQRVLKLEYDKVYNERLYEQHENFKNYVNDHLHKQHSKTTNHIDSYTS